jgi:GntR family transcriptional regulator
MSFDKLIENKESLSDRVKKYILDMIYNGQVKDGEKLPAEDKFSLLIGVSRGTLREALTELERDGVIVRKRGEGTFVKLAPYSFRLQSELERHESILDIAKREGISITYDDLTIAEEIIPNDLIKVLDLDAASRVIKVERVIIAQGMRVGYMIDFIPFGLVTTEEFSGLFQGSVLDVLRGKKGTEVGKAEARIHALNAGDSISAKLKINPSSAILLLEEILYNEMGRAVEYSLNYFVPSFFQFRVNRYYGNGIKNTNG